MKTQLVPYLNFDGNCIEAMKFYQEVLGGNLVIRAFGEAFPDTPDSCKDRAIHAHLESDAINLMASDTTPENSPKFVAGNNVHLSIIGPDATALSNAFNKLAEGGTIDMPLEKQFWGDEFGMLTDKFGVHWMFNVSSDS